MEPGQKFTLISEAARLLDNREWADVELILELFEFPTENWTGTKYEYGLQMVKAGSDDQLVRLHSYLTGGGDSDATVQPWTPGCLRLFVSHLATQKEFVGRLRDALMTRGVDAFVAHADIEPSEEWQNVIEVALRTCHAGVAALHSGFDSSHWTDQEVGFLLARRIPTLPLIFDLDPYGFLGKYQGARCQGQSANQVADRVIDWLLKTPATHSDLAEALTSALAGSRSYSQTRSLLPLIEQLPSLTPEQLVRLEDAAARNPQVMDASVDWTPAPDRIRQLITKHGAPTTGDPWSDEPPF